MSIAVRSVDGLAPILADLIYAGFVFGKKRLTVKFRELKKFPGNYLK